MYKNQTFYSKYKSFDVFQKFSGNYLQSTYSGAIFTILTTIITIYLFLFEFKKYFETKKINQLLVDYSGAEKVDVSLDINLYHLPCSLISFDTRDIIGNDVDLTNSNEEIKKFIIDNSGNIQKIDQNKNKYLNYTESSNDIENNNFFLFTKELINKKLGCKLIVNFDTVKVPGFFRISIQNYPKTKEKILNEIKGYKFDYTHTLNHLFFGKDKDASIVKEKFKIGNINPLAGLENFDDEKKNLFRYFLNIIPTKYYNENGEHFKIYQYTANINRQEVDSYLTGIIFTFDISPFLIKYSLIKGNFFNNLINMCAIVGGMFTLVGIINGLFINIYRKK